MCHALLSDSRFYRFLFQIDLDIASDVQQGGCLHCGGSMHVSCYPRTESRHIPEDMVLALPGILEQLDHPIHGEVRRVRSVL